MTLANQGLFLHEEVLLLVLKDEQGTVEFGANYQYALSGAVLAELLLSERVESQKSKRKDLGVPISTDLLGNAVLDEALEMMARSKKPRTLQDWVSRFANLKNLKHRVATGLCEKGVLKADEDKVLLIFTRKIYPEIDSRPEKDVVGRLEKAIFSETTEIDPRTAVLLSLARSADLLKFPFDRKELKKRKDRIERIVNGELAGKATKQAIEAMEAAVMVACMIPTMVVTTSASD